MRASPKRSFLVAAFGALSLSSLAIVACGSGVDIPIGQDSQPVGCLADADCPGGQACTAGQCTIPQACVPVAETCDGVDEDCDGVVDNNAPCQGGACQNGACVAQSPCADPAQQPAPETCNGLDDDCDGAVDDQAACAVGQQCVNGSCQICNFGACSSPCSSNADCAPSEVCTAGVCGPDPNACQPAPEQCNGLDDDCDGAVDDGATCFLGTCQNGVCTAANMCADPAQVPGPETCNGIDDDCDGVVDNAVTCPQGQMCVNGGCVACNGGQCATPCASDADCSFLQTCQNGFCQ